MPKITCPWQAMREFERMNESFKYDSNNSELGNFGDDFLSQLIENRLYPHLDEIDLGPHICNPVYRTLFILPLSLDNLS